MLTGVPAFGACQAELTAALLTVRAPDRILVVNTEATTDHRPAFELLDRKFAGAPDPSDAAAFAALAARIAARAADVEGTFGELRPLQPARERPSQRAQGSTTFVGRDAELWRRDGLLCRKDGLTGHDAVSRGTVVVSGLGGVGKSVLAEEYVLRFGSVWPGGVFWIDGDGYSEAAATRTREQRVDALDRQLRAIAAQLFLPVDEAPTPADVRAMLDGYLDRAGHDVLWILDDLPPGIGNDELDGLWRSSSSRACALVTTRTRSYDKRYTPCALDVLDTPTGVRLLLRGEPGTSNAADAAAIVEELGALTLAIDVAGHQLATGAWLRLDAYLSTLRAAPPGC